MDENFGPPIGVIQNAVNPFESHFIRIKWHWNTRMNLLRMILSLEKQLPILGLEKSNQIWVNLWVKSIQFLIQKTENTLTRISSNCTLTYTNHIPRGANEIFKVTFYPFSPEIRIIFSVDIKLSCNGRPQFECPPTTLWMYTIGTEAFMRDANKSKCPRVIYAKSHLSAAYVRFRRRSSAPSNSSISSTSPAKFQQHTCCTAHTNTSSFIAQIPNISKVKTQIKLLICNWKLGSGGARVRLFCVATLVGLGFAESRVQAVKETRSDACK